MDIKRNTFFLISIGAIPGALFRLQVANIFVVNLIGCFLLGFFNSFAITKKYKLPLCVGLCGSMTTFSGWSSQLSNLLNQGMYKLFLLNSISMALAGIFVIGLGQIIAKKINI